MLKMEEQILELNRNQMGHVMSPESDKTGARFISFNLIVNKNLSHFS
jgi:hypothetical protein